MALDEAEYNRLKAELLTLLLADSQGVGEVERVSTLENVFSLPALCFSGGLEKVVEVPIELLSLPAKLAAELAEEATARLEAAGVNAMAAADLAETERVGLSHLKRQTSESASEADVRALQARIQAIGAEQATLYALRVASLLQYALARATTVAAHSEAEANGLTNLKTDAANAFAVSRAASEEAERLNGINREFEARLKGFLRDNLSVLRSVESAVSRADLFAAAARTATFEAIAAKEFATRATERLNELSDHRDRVIDGYWHTWNETERCYKNTGEIAKGNLMYATFDINPETGELRMFVDPEYTGANFKLTDGELAVVI